MASGFEERGWDHNGTPEDRLMFAEAEGVDTSDVKPVKKHKLDKSKMLQLHRRLLSYYEQELSRQSTNRHQMAVDEDFYDNIQWSEQDAQALKERGQMPIAYNVISTAVNWVINSQKRMRTDFKVLPRRKDGGKQAERKSQLLKYLDDVNRSQFDISQAFEDAVIAGIGWLEDAIQEEDDGEPLYTRYESWRNILWDSTSVQKDLSDCRYVMRNKWVDVDVAEAFFPDRKGTIAGAVEDAQHSGADFEYGDNVMDSIENAYDESIGNGETHLFDRPRVRLIEVWFKVPTTVKKLKGGDFRGELYDENSIGHNAEIEAGRSVVIEKTDFVVHCAVMTTSGLLWYSKSPYRHNRYPFTPIWGNRRKRDGLPYGLVRGMRDIQEDINKRASKALAILSSNKVIMDEGAVPDLNKFAEEVARPDAILVKKKNLELQLNADRELAPAHLDLMSRSIMMIQQTSGVTDENMGRQTNATSGKAIMARQDQGQLATAHYFDNLRLARQIQGEKQLSLIEQYFTEEKQFRITNMRGTPEYIEINDGMPENDITRTKADFIITETDWNASARQAQVSELLDVMAQIGPVAPQVILSMLDLVVESMDVSNRDELVKRIRTITGQRDPDAEELTPEEQAQEQAKQQQAMMQQRSMMAQIAKAEGDAAYSMARAQKTGAEMQKMQVDIEKLQADLASSNVETQRKALETAVLLLQTPVAVPVADGILDESGFLSAPQKQALAQQALMAQQEMQQRQQMEQQIQQEQAMQQEQAQQGQPQPQGRQLPPV